MKEAGPMQTTKTSPIESIREWDEICREFGCSDDQVRELYSAPCPEAAPATKSYEEVMAIFKQQSADVERARESCVLESQN